MGDGNNSDLILTAAVEMGTTAREIETKMKGVAQAVEQQKVTMNITPEFDLPKLRAQLNELEDEMKTVTSEIQRAEKEMNDLAAATDKAASELDAILPGASKRMAEAMAKGRQAAEHELKKLRKEFENITLAPANNLKSKFDKLLGGVSKRNVKAAQESLVGNSLTSQFDKASKDRIAAGLIARAYGQQVARKELIERYNAVPRNTGNKEADAGFRKQRAQLRKRINEVTRKANEYNAEVDSFFDGDKVIKKEVIKLALAIQKRREAIENAPKDGLTKLDEIGGNFMTTAERAAAARSRTGRLALRRSTLTEQEPGVRYALTEAMKAATAHGVDAEALASREPTVNMAAVAAGWAAQANAQAAAHAPGGPAGPVPPSVIAAAAAGGADDGAGHRLRLDHAFLVEQLQKACDGPFKLTLDEAHLKEQVQGFLKGAPVEGTPAAVNAAGTATGPFQRTLDLATAHISSLAYAAKSAAEAVISMPIGKGKAAKEASDAAIALRAVSKDMPKIAEGMMRLYRVGDKGSFTRDRDNAESAARTKGGRLVYVDLPAEQAMRYKGEGHALSPNTIFTVPSNMLSGMPDESPEEKRNRMRGEQVTKKTVRRMSKDPATAEEFLRRVGAEHLIPLMKDASAYMYAQKDTPEWEAAGQKAIPAIRALRKGLEQFEQGDGTDRQKELVKVFHDSFMAKFGTQAENRTDHIAMNGPNPRAIGALSVFDKLNMPMLVEAREKRFKEISAQMNAFTGHATDFGDAKFRDRYAEATKAYRKYTDARIKMENELRNFADADTMEEKEALAKRVLAAKREMEFAQETAAYRALSMKKGTIAVPTELDGVQKLSYNQARIGINRRMVQALGADYERVAASHGGLDAFSFGDFKKGLFGGNKGVAEEFLRAKGYSEQILNDQKAMNEALEKEIGHLREIHKIEGKIDNELRTQTKSIAASTRGGSRGGRNPFTGINDFARNAFAVFGGIGIGYTAANEIRNQMRSYIQYKQEIADIQGVLKSKSPFQAETLSRGVMGAASKYGVDLVQAAQSAKLLAQSGMDANEVVKALNTTFAASKGLGISIEDVQDLQIAVRAVTADNDKFNASIDYGSAVLDKISVVESRYAVTSHDLASAIKLLTPLLDNFADGMTGLADSFDYTNGMATVMVEKLRITGTQAANSLKMIFSRITRPETLNKLQKDFKLQIGNAETGDYLPLDQMLQQFGEKYHSLKGTDRKAFVTELSGGRNVHTITALLEDYVRVQKIANESAMGYGEIQKRSQIATETFGTSIDKLKTNFQKFTTNLLDTSYAAKGMQDIFAKLGSFFNGKYGDGMVTPWKTLGAILAAGVGVQIIRTIYGIFAAMASGTAVSAVFKGLAFRIFTLRAAMVGAATAGEALTAVLGGVVAVFGAGALLIGGLVLATSMWGKYKAAQEDAIHGLDKYIVKSREFKDLNLFDAPQVKEFGGRFATDEASMVKLGGDVQGAYQSVYDRSQLVQGNAPGFDGTVHGDAINPAKQKRMLEIYNEFASKQGKAQEEWVKNNKAAVQEYQRLYTEAFISTLPDAAKKGFEAISGNGERTAEVVKAVGGAAFIAANLMLQTIQDINTATQQMVDDTMEGLNRINERKKQGEGGPNLFDRVDSIFKGGEYNPESYSNGAGGVWNLAKDRMRQRQQIMNGLQARSMDLPVLKVLLRDKGTFNVLHKDVLNDNFIESIMKGGADVDYSQITQLLLSELNRTPEGQQKQAIATLVAEKQWGKLSKFPLAMLNSTLSPQEKSIMALNTGMSLAKDNTLAFTKSALEQANQGPTTTKTQYELLQQYGTGTPGMIDPKNNQSGGAALAFKNTLLDLVLAMKESIHKMRAEEKFASDYNLAYDKPSALMSFGKEILEKGNAYAGGITDDIIRLQDEMRNIATREKGLPPDAKERVKLQHELDLRQKELKEFGSKGLAEVLGNTTEGQTALKEIQTAIADIGVSGGDMGEKINKVFQLIGDAAVKFGQKLSYTQKSEIQAADMYRAIVEKTGALNEAALPITAKLADKMRVRAATADMVYQAELRSLDVRRKHTNMSLEEYKLQRENLANNYEVNKMYEARMGVLEAQRSLDEQIMSNIEAAMNPIRSLLTDPSVWQNVVGWDKAWHDRAEGIRTLFLQTFSGIAKGFNDRLFENLNQRLMDKLFQMGPMKDIFGATETKLKENLTGAKIFESGIISGSRVGAAMFAAALAGRGFAGQPGAPSDGGFAAGGVGVGGGTAGAISMALSTANDVIAKKAKADLDLQKKKMLYAGIGMMAGQVGGTLLGRGGQNAQMGSQIGSTLGMGSAALIGMKFGAVGGPVGLAIGAAVGGLLGGFLGGKKDKKDTPEQPVVKGLEAIERAQRETITTIQAQTDALLKPENRLMNLPSNFNVPAYNPGGLGVSGSGRLAIDINVNGNASPELHDQIADAAERAINEKLGDFLSDQRRNGTWG